MTVCVNSRSVEVTTFRSDGAYADHRHPTAVSFVGDLTTDLSRRDFTMNAIALPPDGLVADIAAKAKVIAIDALSLSLEAGSAKAVNVVLIGVLARSSDISKEVWIQTIKDTVPAKFLDLNLKAFELGYNCGC